MSGKASSHPTSKTAQRLNLGGGTMNDVSDRVIGVARCPRGRHVIARAFADRIELREAVVSGQGVTWKWETHPTDPFRETAAYGWLVSCPCGVLLNVDVAALSRGGDCRVEPQGPGHTGVSFDRDRNAVL